MYESERCESQSRCFWEPTWRRLFRNSQGVKQYKVRATQERTFSCRKTGTLCPINVLGTSKARLIIHDGLRSRETRGSYNEDLLARVHLHRVTGLNNLRFVKLGQSSDQELSIVSYNIPRHSDILPDFVCCINTKTDESNFPYSELSFRADNAIICTRKKVVDPRTIFACLSAIDIHSSRTIHNQVTKACKRSSCIYGDRNKH
jgi:hypothetical protein